MNENAGWRPSMPKWIEPLLTVTILFVLFQALFMLTIGDSGIISQTKATAKAERDLKGASSYFHSRSNEEIDKIVDNRRDAVIANFHKEKVKPILVKMAFGALILFVALGVRKRKPKPTRLLAMIAGLLMVLSIVVTFSTIGQSLAAFRYTDSKLIVLLDIVWYVLVWLTAIACFVAFVKLKAYAVTKTAQESPEKTTGV
jgi:hypothetical protein